MGLISPTSDPTPPIRPVLRVLLDEISAAFEKAVKGGITLPEALSALLAQTRPLIMNVAEPHQALEFMDTAWMTIMSKLQKDLP